VNDDKEYDEGEGEDNHPDINPDKSRVHQFGLIREVIFLRKRNLRKRKNG
jgi:hypothetical protein